MDAEKFANGLHAFQKASAVCLARSFPLCQIAPGRTPRARLESGLDELGRRDIQDLFLEGGPTLAGAMFDAGEIDGVRLFMAPVLVGAAQARAVLEGEGVARIAEGVRPLETRFEELGEDLLVSARLREW